MHALAVVSEADSCRTGTGGTALVDPVTASSSAGAAITRTKQQERLSTERKHQCSPKHCDRDR